MNWLARLKKTSTSAQEDATKATEAPFVAFVAPPPAPLQNFEVSADVVNDPAFDAGDMDRWCWPHSGAMTGAEIELMLARQALFSSRGLRVADAEALSDSLMRRDREMDDRRLCLECANLRGKTCAVPAIAGAGAIVQALVRLPQRCAGFEAAA
ncbi:hypothetical protein WKW77_20005 [Variovorax ureilyticus]|uniref:Uncharacterized protein n=1 Tax=Variovorax ureilyticus TaxID=1836198 RepID=A0ABU8VI87_9BURK